MSGGAVLQTIGIVFMALGSILAIEGLRKHLKQVKEEARLDFAKMGFIALLFEILDDSMQRLTRQGKIGTQERNRFESFILGICFRSYAMLLMFYLDLKHTIFKFLERKCISIGILFIFLGAIMQCLATWL